MRACQDPHHLCSAQLSALPFGHQVPHLRSNERLHEYWQATGGTAARDAASHAAGLFLDHRPFRGRRAAR